LFSIRSYPRFFKGNWFISVLKRFSKFKDRINSLIMGALQLFS
jgi:hypothetical protein